jgi:hypothetical protein
MPTNACSRLAWLPVRNGEMARRRNQRYGAIICDLERRETWRAIGDGETAK